MLRATLYARKSWCEDEFDTAKAYGYSCADILVPIPGTAKPHRLEENIVAAAVEPTPGDLPDIDGAIARIAAQGDRHSAERQKPAGR